jgi:hypothetical protein
MNNLTRLFWNEHFESKTRPRLSKMGKKIYDWLNEDNFNGFVLDNKVFWVELVCTTSRLPNNIYTYIIKWAKLKGYKYLYD